MDHDGGGNPGSPGIADTAGGLHAGAAARGHGEGRKVLVIEDEPNISEAIRFILRRDGWNVTTHAVGTDALARMESVRPDLVILDVMLPGMSGFDILRAIRADPGLGTVPVILLTARGQVASRAMAREYGASMFMAKPFANAELLAAVRQLVGA